MHSGILSKPLRVDPALLSPWRHSGRTGMFTRATDEVLLGKWKNHLTPSASISFHTLPSLLLRDTFSCPEPPASPNRLGLWVVQSMHQPPGCKREAFSPLCESNKYSARDSLAFLIISGALGADLHPRQDPIRSQDLPEQSSDKWNPLWWHFLFPHQVLFLHFLPELSVSTFPQPWLSPLCAPQVP